MALFIQPKLHNCKYEPMLRLQNSVRTEFSCCKCRRNRKLRKNMHCLYGVLARATKN